MPIAPLLRLACVDLDFNSASLPFLARGCGVIVAVSHASVVVVLRGLASALKSVAQGERDWQPLGNAEWAEMHVFKVRGFLVYFLKAMLRTSLSCFSFLGFKSFELV